MKSILKTLFLSTALFVLIPVLASAQPNKGASKVCGSCHNGTALGPGMTVEASVDGVEGTSFSVSPGATIEIDWVFREMRGSTPTRGVTALLGLPTGWTPQLTTNTSNPATLGGTAWSTWWDNAMTKGTPASDTPTWQVTAAETGVAPNGMTSSNVYKMLMEGSQWESGSGSTADGGNGTDLDGVTDVMGADVRVTVPATGGPWTVYVGGVGHDTSAKAMVTAAITISLSGGDTTNPAVGTVTPANVDYAGTHTDATFDVSAAMTEANTLSSCDVCVATDGTCDTEWTAASVGGSAPNWTCTATGVGPYADGASLTINMRGTDNSANTGTGTPINRTADAAAPTTTDNYPGGTVTVDQNLTLSPSDGGSGVASTDWCVDTTNACTPGTDGDSFGTGTSVSVTCGAGSECTQYLRYLSTDNVGNAETVNSTTTIIDKKAPTVSSTVPTNGAPSVALDSTVTINFDENVACATVNTTNITSDSPGWALDTCSGSTVTFMTSGQANNTTYNVNVSTAVTDANGNAMAAAYPFSYTTIAAGNNPPAIPANPEQKDNVGPTLIAIGGYSTTTTLVFEADLFDTDGDTVKLQVDYTGDNNSDCESAALVASGTNNHQITCAGLVDGNSYDWQYRAVDSNAAASAWTAFNAASPDFRVDATAPSVSSTTPTNGATGVTINSQVTINFDEDVCATVNTTNVTSDSPTWTLNDCTAGVAVFDTGGQAATTLYSVSVTAAVTDPAGNPLSAAPYNFSYTTGAAVNNAPTVTGSLAQYEHDPFTTIAGGGNSANNAVVVEAQINDGDGDVLILEVDIDSDGNVDCVSPAVTGSGTPQALCTALPDGAYDWQVRAKDSKDATSGWSPLGGSPDFNIVAGVDIGFDFTPPTESGLNVTPGDSIIDLSWNVADDGTGSGLDPVNTYKVARSTVGNPVDCDTGTIYTGNINSYSDTSVSNGTTYYYRVCAYDNVGNGSTGQTGSGTPGSSCTPGAPIATILTASKDITVDGGFVDYTIQVTNQDAGACAATSFDLVMSAHNPTSFYAPTFATDPLVVAAGSSAQTTIRVTMIAGQPNSSTNTTSFHTNDGVHGDSPESGTVTTTINVSGGGCVASGDQLNTNGDNLRFERR